MEKTVFGRPKNVLLFGGGRVLRHLALRLGEKGIDVFVFSSKRLLEEEHDGMKLQQFLEKNRIGFESTRDINSSEKAKALAKSSVGISFGAPWIFKKEFLEMFGNRILNSHSMDLPRNRGGGGFSWMILNSDRKSSSLLHIIDGGIDTGPIVKRADFVFPKNCKIPKDFEEVKFKADKKFFDEFVEELAAGKEFSLEKQDEDRSSYFPRLHSMTQGFIDWAWGKEEIERFIDAFDEPYCGASTWLNGERVFLKGCSGTNNNDTGHPFLAGIVYRKRNGKIFIGCRNGGIAIGKALNEKGESVFEKVRLGDRFFTPRESLENAMLFRPIYGPDGLKEGKK